MANNQEIEFCRRLLYGWLPDRIQSEINQKIDQRLNKLYIDCALAVGMKLTEPHFYKDVELGTPFCFNLVQEALNKGKGLK